MKAVPFLARGPGSVRKMAEGESDEPDASERNPPVASTPSCLQFLPLISLSDGLCLGLVSQTNPFLPKLFWPESFISATREAS